MGKKYSDLIEGNIRVTNSTHFKWEKPMKHAFQLCKNSVYVYDTTSRHLFDTILVLRFVDIPHKILSNVIHPCIT